MAADKTRMNQTKKKKIQQGFLFKKQLHKAPLEWPHTSTNQPFSSPVMHLGYERILFHGKEFET